MDVPTMAANNKQRSSPANDSRIHQQQPQQPAPYPYPIQQQPQGSWTPSITAAPFYPSFYQHHYQQQSPQLYPQQSAYFDPANAHLAQWAYQEMMFDAQHEFSQMPFQQHHSPQQRSTNSTATTDYFAQNQISPPFDPFPSGTPPPHQNRGGAGDHQHQGQQSQYTGFLPYRRPSRQTQQESSDSESWRPTAPGPPHPPYARPEASVSTSSLNSSRSHRQRTNSNQSGNSGRNIPSFCGRNSAPTLSSSNRSTPSPASSSPSTATGQLRILRHPNSFTSSSTSTATTRSSALSPHSSAATTSSSSSISSTSISTPIPRPARPSPLSQGNFTAAEKRMSRDDSDLIMLDPTPTASMLRSGGLKGRLRRALSFNATQSLAEDDDVSIKASAHGATSSKLKPKLPDVSNSTDGSKSGGGGTVPRSPLYTATGDGAASSATVQTKKKSRAGSLFNSRLNASMDNVSLSSTVSSASVMIRKLGSMGRFSKRNSLAGITSLFKDKDKKGSAHGLSPAAKLARQHTLKSNAEAAARAKAQQEASAEKVNGVMYYSATGRTNFQTYTTHPAPFTQPGEDFETPDAPEGAMTAVDTSENSPGAAFFSHSSDVHIDGSGFEAAGRDIVTYIVHLVGADDGHRTEVLVAGNFVTSLLGAHATNIYHSRHLKLCPDTAAHAVSVANTRYHVIYERPFLALSLWAFILYTIKYGGRVRNV